MAAGHGGVAVFFVLSGYLITTLGLREIDERGSVSLRAFYTRRTLRIFPLHFYVLGVTCLLVFTCAGEPGKAALRSALPDYLTYTGEYAPVAHFYPSWSLGIEEKFYLLWPLLCFVALRRKPTARFAIAAAFSLLPLAAGILPASLCVLDTPAFWRVAWSRRRCTTRNSTTG